MKKTNARNAIRKAALAVFLIPACLFIWGCQPKEPGTPVPPESGWTVLREDGTLALSLEAEEGSPASVADEIRKLEQDLAKALPAGSTAKSAETEGKIIVKTRDFDTTPEGRILEYEGYLIRGTETGIEILGGNVCSTVDALQYFFSLRPESGAFTVPKDFTYAFHPFMKVQGLTAAGKPLADYGLCLGGEDGLRARAAEVLPTLIFEKTGEFLTGTEQETGEGCIVLDQYSENGETSGRVTVENGKILVKTTERIGFVRVFRDFLDQVAEEQPGKAAAVPEGYCFIKDYGEFITYEDFGAVGDGKTEDSPALAEAHKEANAKGIPVLAREDRIYYIGKKSKTSKVQTDCDWSAARFIIDDSQTSGAGGYVFSVPATSSKTTSLTKEVKKLASGQTELNVTLPGRVLVSVTNEKVRQYIRKGANQDNGHPMKEIFIADAAGKIDPLTPIVWDFDKITSITYRSLEEEPITLRGGYFTTVANRAKSEYNYWNRGFGITRSNVTVLEMHHYVTEEGDTGAPYSGFLMISDCAGSVVKDTVLTPHKTYVTVGSAGVPVKMGTYECQISYCPDAAWIHVIQSRDVNDTLYWGCFASNYSKNITFDGCRLNRFDAHCGVYNVTLRNSSFGHQGINLIGHGTALIENCKIFAANIVNLRDDYGSTWNGDLIIRDSSYYPGFGSGKKAVLIGGTNTFDHDFGYTCYLPRNVIVENLYVDDSHPEGDETPKLYADINPAWNSADYKGKYPMVMTESVTFSHVVTRSGKPVEVSENTWMFGELTVQTK